MAVPTLHRLASHFDVALVVTQPDRAVGRSRTPRPPAVKRVGTELGIPVVQPQRSLDTADLLERHGPFAAAVLVAFGQLIRPEALAVPSHGFLNVHFSLLPRWRGAAPVQRALMAGDRQVGVSVMCLDDGLDTGPVVAARSTSVGRHEDAGLLLDRLARRGAELVTAILPRYLAGDVIGVRQPDRGATMAPKITAEDRVIAWERAAESIVAQIRGLAPRPAAQAMLGDTPVKILRAEVAPGSADPGEIFDEGLVGTGSGLVRLVTVQPAGKQPMPAGAWLRGLRSPSPTFV